MRILKFSAEWCGPCRTLKKNLEDSPYPIESIDADESPDLCSQYNIRNIPTIVILDDKDHEITRMVGAISLQMLIDKINELK